MTDRCHALWSQAMRRFERAWGIFDARAFVARHVRFPALVSAFSDPSGVRDPSERSVTISLTARTADRMSLRLTEGVPTES
jgi:hypothetical protein